MGMEIKMSHPESTKSIQDYARWALLCCAIGWILSVYVEAESANAADDPPAPAAKPATLAEIRQAIDWFKFPKPDGAMWEMTDLQGTHYWVPGTIAQAAEFYRKTMTAQGWSEVKKANPDPEPDKYQSCEFTKAGFLVGLGISGNKTHAEVRLYHLGNVDARRLPTPADAKVTPAHSSYVSYSTASKPDVAAAFCRKEIAAQGWRETPSPEAKVAAKKGITILRFVQNATECKVTITPKKEGETEVTYHTFLRREFEPAEVVAFLAVKEIPKPATVKDALQTLDLRKLPHLGEVAPKSNTGLKAEYETRASVAKAVAFYRKTLADQGWVLVPPLVDLEARGALEFEKSGYLLSLRIENLNDRPKKTGLVKIELTNHGNVDLRQLPYMPGAEFNMAYPDRYRASATAEAAAAFYRKELGKLGWKETGKRKDDGKYGYHLEFIQNDSHLKIVIDNTRDGQTAIQLNTWVGDER
jgi:hypothetical protein